MNNKDWIPFTKPLVSGKELEFITSTLNNSHWHGDGPFTRDCEELLTQITGIKPHLLTHSCTGALEMMSLLLDLKQGDEVIMPSYTFVSTALAFARCGAVPVFIDIDSKTKNIGVKQVQKAITNKTKAIVAVNYGGVCAPLDELRTIADQANICLLEDAAQSIGAKFKQQHHGSFASLSAFSFHATKNIAAGEGGSLAINDPKFIERAEIIREKGTNRSQFLQGQVDKYTWVDTGSSYVPSEFNAAILKAQLTSLTEINSKRMRAWNAYHAAFEQFENAMILERMFIPPDCQHNAHVYYLLLKDLQTRNRFLEWMKKKKIQATFHYVPLHSSPAGKKYGRAMGSLQNTVNIYERLVRLPLYPEVPYERVINEASKFFETEP